MTKYRKKNAKDIMAFATRLGTNSLPSPDNLKRWGKRKMSTCPLCKNPSGTLAHIVNICPVALKQQRFTWRHNSILQHITSEVKKLAPTEIEVFSDLPGHGINGTTIPADILVTNGEGSKPDLVLIKRKEKKIIIMELTCPLVEYNVDQAHKDKAAKYTPLELSLKERGYKVQLVPFEIGSSGHITKQIRIRIQDTLKVFNIKLKPQIITNLAKISLICTMSIFHAYQTSEWIKTHLLEP